MKFSRKEVFEMVDALFHKYASFCRSEAKEELVDIIQRREDMGQREDNTLEAENERLRTALEQLADDKDATDRIQTAIDVLNDHDMYEEANNLKVKTNADEH